MTYRRINKYEMDFQQEYNRLRYISGCITKHYYLNWKYAMKWDI